jgi:tetratricopeptide (TPR) repeat protein
MNRGMRHVVSSTVLATVYLLSVAPVFAQLPPWGRQDQRRPYGPPPQRSYQPPQHAQPQRAPQPQQQTQPQQQARPAQPAPVEPQQQVQQKAKPEPVPQNTQERATCLNKETQQALLITACSVIIDSGREKPNTLATAYFHRGDAYREKGDQDSAIKDLTESINLDSRNAKVFIARATTYRAKGELDNAIADFDQAIKLDPRDPNTYSSRSHAFYEKRNYQGAIEDLTVRCRISIWC